MNPSPKPDTSEQVNVPIGQVGQRVSPSIRAQPTLQIAATGYLSATAGSVAGANSVLLQKLLSNGHGVCFGSKPWFVDPRPIVAGHEQAERLSFVDCSNGYPDRLNRWARSSASGYRRLFRPLVAIWDDRSYRRTISRRLQAEAPSQADVCLWLGTWAARSMQGIPTVSWAQGPPGTDARSVARHADEIRQLGGLALLLKLRAYAAWRAGPGLPRFDQSDHLIVGSEWSRQDLQQRHAIDGSRVHALPYPIDLDLFRPPAEPRSSDGPLRVMWLGRFVPRKRLPLFLDGVAEAIRQGIDIDLTVVGSSGFVPNYERFLEAFPYRERLTHIPSMPRTEVPGLMARQDLLIQPSDDENFGSSVAEAQACGMPVVVGSTNGTADYVCDRSIRLADDRTETLATAIATLADAKRSGSLAAGQACRAAAECHCDPARVVAGLEAILRLAINDGTQP